MIYRIIGSYLFFCLLVAVGLSIGGVSSTTELDSYIQASISQINRELILKDFSIPNIPKIPTEWVVSSDSIWDVVPLVRIAKMLTILLNMLISLLNGVVFILNMIIKLFIFVVTCYKVFAQMNVSIISASSTTSGGAVMSLCSW